MSGISEPPKPLKILLPPKAPTHPVTSQGTNTPSTYTSLERSTYHPVHDGACNIPCSPHTGGLQYTMHSAHGAACNIPCTPHTVGPAINHAPRPLWCVQHTMHPAHGAACNIPCIPHTVEWAKTIKFNLLFLSVILNNSQQAKTQTSI